MPEFQIWHHFHKKIVALIHKNVWGMFDRCIIYEIWISSFCDFCVDQHFCYVECEHLHNLEERASCLTLFCYRLGYLDPWTFLHTHTCKNLIPMVVTRAMANSCKNHALLMCTIWKMGWFFFSSLDIRENPLFVLFPA